MAPRRLPPRMTLKRSSERGVSMIYFWIAVALLLAALWHLIPSSDPIDDLCPDQECEVEEVFPTEDELDEDIFTSEAEEGDEDFLTPTSRVPLVEIYQNQEDSPH